MIDLDRFNREWARREARARAANRRAWRRRHMPAIILVAFAAAVVLAATLTLTPRS